jgi:hypothetical protein
VYDKETGRLDEISLDDIILSADKEQETALNLDMI